MYAQTYVYIYFNTRRYLRPRDMVAVSTRVFRRQDNYHCDMLGLQFEKAPLPQPPRVDAFSNSLPFSLPLSLFLSLALVKRVSTFLPKRTNPITISAGCLSG